MRSRLLALIVVLVVASGGYIVLAGRSEKASSQNQVQYRQEAVALGELRSTITGTGPIASANGVMIRSTQSGTVVGVRAQDGDRLKAGDLVVLLDNENLAAQYKQAQLDLATSLANLDALLHPLPVSIRGQELKVEQARLAVKQRVSDQDGLQVKAHQAGIIASVKAIQGSNVAANALLFTIFDDRSPDFIAAVSQGFAAGIKVGQSVTVEIAGFGSLTGKVLPNAAVASPTTGSRDSNVPIQIALPAALGIRAGMVGQASFMTAGIEYPIVAYGSIHNDAIEVRSLVAGTVGTVTVREGDRVNEGDLLLSLKNDQLDLSHEQAVADLKLAEHNLSTLVDPELDPNGQVRTLRNKIEAAQITIALRKSDRGDLQIKAPVDGQLSALAVRMGDRVANNQQLFRVADYGTMQVTIMVDELDVAKTRLGQEAAITLDALSGQPFRGIVTKINPEGIFRNDIATFEVTVTVANPQGLMAGMNASVNITVEDRVGLYVPAQSVTVREGRATVQVLENNAPVQREIKIGLRAGQRVEVLSGLAQGDLVITTIVRPQQTNINIPFLGGQRAQPTPTPTTPQVRP